MTVHEMTRQMLPGYTLSNRAVVLKHEPNGTRVLCFWANSPRDPFVVWNVDTAHVPFSGRYFATLDSALACYNHLEGVTA